MSLNQLIKFLNDRQIPFKDNFPEITEGKIRDLSKTLNEDTNKAILCQSSIVKSRFLDFSIKNEKDSVFCYVHYCENRLSKTKEFEIEVYATKEKYRFRKLSEFKKIALIFFTFPLNFDESYERFQIYQSKKDRLCRIEKQLVKLVQEKEKLEKELKEIEMKESVEKIEKELGSEN